MSFATFRTWVMMCVLASGVSNVAAMRVDGNNPLHVSLSQAFVAGHKRIFQVLAQERTKGSDDRVGWESDLPETIALKIYGDIFPLDRHCPLSSLEERQIIATTKKRIRDSACIASNLVDGVIKNCIDEQAQLKRSCTGWTSDPNDI